MTLAVDLSTRFTATGAEPFDIDVAFEVDPGESLVVLGPSGSGKTLVLETVAGFHPSNGTVENNGRDLTGIPPEQRDFGFVFQDYALFPHKTVRENIRFSERYRDGTRGFDDLLAEFDITDLTDRYPPTLSGGEKQRVALARALYASPDVLLLDEPLSSLDAPTQQTLRSELADVLSAMTVVYVTHNRTTARALADRIAVMHDGQIIQTSTPDDVFERPASPFVARFTGANCLQLDAVPGFDGAGESGEASTLAIRPEHIVFDPETPDATATVTHVTREDAASRVSLALDGADESLDAFSVQPPTAGDTVKIGLPRERTTLFGDRRSSRQ